MKDKSKSPKKWRRNSKYRKWKREVISIGHCECCGRSDRPLDAHHLEHGQSHPKLRFVVSNGVALCRTTDGEQGCHSRFHNDYMSGTREKCTKHDYQEFKRLADYFIELSSQGVGFFKRA